MKPRKAVVILLVTFIIGLCIFFSSFLLCLLIAFATIFKKVGATSLGVVAILFLILFPCFCLTMELAIFHEASDAWGVAYIFIAMNVFLLIFQYVFLVGSAIFTKNSIYRLTKFFVWKKHTYDDVIGYVMKKSSEQIWGKFGRHKVVTFDIEIYFSGNQYACFSTRDQNNRKVVHIKQLLEKHHCRRNGRIQRKSRLQKMKETV